MRILDQKVKKLTKRELQVFILLGRGNTPKEASIILGISSKTIATHRMTILIKMDLKNTYQMMSYCIRAEMDSDEFMEQWI